MRGWLPLLLVATACSVTRMPVVPAPRPPVIRGDAHFEVLVREGLATNAAARAGDENDSLPSGGGDRVWPMWMVSGAAAAGPFGAVLEVFSSFDAAFEEFGPTGVAAAPLLRVDVGDVEFSTIPRVLLTSGVSEADVEGTGFEVPVFASFTSSPLPELVMTTSAGLYYRRLAMEVTPGRLKDRWLRSSVGGAATAAFSPVGRPLLITFTGSFDHAWNGPAGSCPLQPRCADVFGSPPNVFTFDLGVGASF